MRPRGPGKTAPGIRMAGQPWKGLPCLFWGTMAEAKQRIRGPTGCAAKRFIGFRARVGCTVSLAGPVLPVFHPGAAALRTARLDVMAGQRQDSGTGGKGLKTKLGKDTLPFVRGKIDFLGVPILSGLLAEPV